MCNDTAIDCLGAVMCNDTAIDCLGAVMCHDTAIDCLGLTGSRSINRGTDAGCALPRPLQRPHTSAA